MDLKNLKEKKKKITSTPVRIEEDLYNKISSISKKEKVSIIKMTEFLLESAVEDYSKLKTKKKNQEDKELKIELINEFFKIHENTINDTLTDETQKKALKKSLETFKKYLFKHVRTIDDYKQISVTKQTSSFFIS
jgi:hypothetical protein